jgi:P-type Ca2+ transporter type 2C
MIHVGLKESEVFVLQKKFGPNFLPTKESLSWLSILFSQFKSPLVYILVLVGLASWLFGQTTDAKLIGAVITLNVLMGFFQEYRSQKTLLVLTKILKPRAFVIRDGERKQIDATQIVPGDLVVLGGGDRVPADGKMIQGINLLVNEAILTGEEEAVTKNPEENINLFMGTTVIWGAAVMEVKKIGKETQMGQISQSVAKIRERKTPIQMSLEKFARTLMLIILAVCAFIFLAGVLKNQDIWQMLRISIILAVAAIPEGMPIAITVILTLGMRRILRRNGLVKKLLSIETLGSTSVICVDKTGTLTEGVMKVVATDFSDGKKAHLALALVNNQRTNFEIALWNYFKEKEEFDHKKIPELYPRLYEEPFDSEKKYSMTINQVDGDQIALMLGAPEIILSFCNASEERKKEIMAKIDNWADQGLRVVAAAFKNKGDLKEKKDYSWVGLVGIQDPIRESAAEAILKTQEAGIKIKIVTGDYRKTAENVARRLGLSIGPENIMEGGQLEKLSQEELAQKIEGIYLFVRILPHQKLKIVKALQAKGERVAMTGDGVNDAPALKAADIGVALGSGSEVAKEVSDLILLDNNFKTIEAAVEEGRLIYANIKKVVGYVLSNSFVEIVLIFGAIMAGLPAPLTIVQILWIHLICDGPPDIILGFERKEKGLMREKPRDIKKDEILSGYMKFLIFSISLTAGLAALTFFWYFRNKTGNLELARTVAFAAIAAVDLIYVFSFKNLKSSIIKTGRFFDNKLLILGVIYGFVLLFAAIYLPGLNRILGTKPLLAWHWLLVFGLGLGITLLIETVKVLANKNSNNH